ncbi:hypothetical protein J19TS1_33670 [Heyndrickxia oleronia]|nr:hypothetical protein J19TS1_33670 [Heyndrickxia oleronia]
MLAAVVVATVTVMADMVDMAASGDYFRHLFFRCLFIIYKENKKIHEINGRISIFVDFFCK